MKAGTKIMGVLNVTPDSFYDGGRFDSESAAIQQGLKLAEEGADWIDIGGESSRPGSDPISSKEEQARVLPIIEFLAQETSVSISIDTKNGETAALALEKGATLINDITGFSSPLMQEVAAESNTDLCLMHMQGNPSTMQLNPSYPEGIIPTLIHYFEDKIEQLLKKGIKKERIWIDPGIGFGKNVAHNLEIIQNLPKLKELEAPIILGVSRKSFLQKILEQPAAELLEATLVANAIGIVNGADMIRVHDVREHRKIIKFLDVYASWEQRVEEGILPI